MNEYNITKIEKSSDDIVFSPKTDNEIEKIFDTLIEVNTEDLIVKESCKLCNFRLRYDAERFWESCEKNYTQTVQWINDQVSNFNATVFTVEEKEPLFTIANVRNHMRNHYSEQERQIRLKDYSSKIGALINIKQDKRRLLDVAIAVCYENLSRIASMETNGEVKNEKIRSEAISKIISNILSIIDVQGKLDGEISSFGLIQEKFEKVWIDFINKEQSDAKKKILIHMLEEFNNNFNTA